MISKPHMTAADLGRRIAAAREEGGLTQSQLAEAVGIDRTAINKIESGTRKISATELLAVATVLGRPIDWFVTDTPASIVSRRRDVGHKVSKYLDQEVEARGRDVEFLVDRDILKPPTEIEPVQLPQDFARAEELASKIRALADVSDRPVRELQAVCERLGLLVFSESLGAEGGDAAYVHVEGFGVAVINGDVDPGRRRFNLAHELGHHVLGDAYAPEATIGSHSDTEQMINAFSIHFLLPRSSVVSLWNELSPRGRRFTALTIAARFRVSWSATCSQLRNLGLIDEQERVRLTAQPPRPGDWIELGESWTAELGAPGLPPNYSAQVVSAYRTGKLSAARAVELLLGTLAEQDLPDLEAVDIEDLHREFDPLP